MASVVAGRGIAGFGFESLPGGFGIVSSPAYAQVNNDVSKVAQPVGFADIVQRVKPSVISVKVTMKDKAPMRATAVMMGRTSQAHPWSVSFVSLAALKARLPERAIT